MRAIRGVWLGLMLALPAVATAASAPPDGATVELWHGRIPPDGTRQAVTEKNGGTNSQTPASKADPQATQASLPNLTIHLPKSNPTHTAVVVCPGGGYGFLAFDWEGTQVARWFNAHGVAVFILQYRFGPKHHYPQPTDDGRRAMRWVRYHAADYGIDPRHIGIMGFSAGGHLASTVSTHYADSTAIGHDAIARVSARPDFTILGYPVITMKKSFTHMGSRQNLLGKHPSQALVNKLSNETQVTSDTPPAFIYVTDADTLVPPTNSIEYYLALHRHHVPAELHVFRVGGHGSGLGSKDKLLAVWPDLLARWMAGMGLMTYPGLGVEHSPIQ
ncbi:alpha/beta hydrolase [Oleiagrimonas sp. C23AA]|uniref:alpha/beta hydrolase n=1 Tax=Oleiagrimonas sp. C23AA TaxID=2719047 RepID=UPI001421BDD3|nr:alpha/beta hydrolase [Oleiagrimonas sp. C23AA]NII09856.1 alpha/beta hydrolase [Oleiagrimonas sp. C23AA]